MKNVANGKDREEEVKKVTSALGMANDELEQTVDVFNETDNMLRDQMRARFDLMEHVFTGSGKAAQKRQLGDIEVEKEWKLAKPVAEEAHDRMAEKKAEAARQLASKA